mmetsp:Transcript_19689/g.40623  ORF Transcript_19689/g.40623 Transcript_19689/m.40623 type:complete len:132 (-) Transcript_19689:537-932(-)
MSSASSYVVREDLEYPNLATCQLKLVGAAATARPPVVLPREIRDAAREAYRSNGKQSLDDFSLERAVLKRRDDRDRDFSLKGATSREELEKATIAKMKSVTGAENDDVCIAILRNHNYDVGESIEAYLESR